MILFKRQIKGLCNNCMTGWQACKLDSREPMCPYIDSYRNKKCFFYNAIGEKKVSLFKKLLNKILIFRIKQ